MLYHKKTCTKRRSLEEPVVSYNRNGNDSASNNLTQVTVLPTVSLTGYSGDISSPSYKNPLLTRSYLNLPKKDSVIKLPSFATSTPIGCKNVTRPGFATPSTSISSKKSSMKE